jgi:hypothetical protein
MRASADLSYSRKSVGVGCARGDRRGLRISARPLLALVEVSGGFAACARSVTGHHLIALERVYLRALEEGDLTVYAADVLAITLLGLHPMGVWGEDWLEVTPRPRAVPRRALERA